MKNMKYFAIAVFFFACSDHIQLEKEEAASVIRSGNEFPKVFEYNINTADPASAKKLLDAGMETEGLVTVDRTQKLEDAGKPIVHFTEKAKPYLILMDAKYPKDQVVRIADRDLGEITGVQLLDDQKRANVEYTVVYKNITPFAKLLKRDLTKPETKRASLSMFDTGWKLDK